jgi:hypothetical protein
MKKPTLAWIDHSYHKKTKSSFFLKDLLSPHFEITEYWDESWAGKNPINIEDINKHDYIVFFQVISSEKDLKKLKKPFIWVPMYDGEKFNYGQWKILSKHRVAIISFSKKISAWANKFSIPTFTVQYYYIEPSPKLERTGENHIFFWFRNGISFSKIREMIDPRQVDSFTLICNSESDKQMLGISEDDIKNFKISFIVNDFMSRDRYMDLLNRCSIFIAPRKKEGIGAFTEALALGKCVIAYNDAVHNEYIFNGKDGILFDEKTRRIDLTDSMKLGEAAWLRAREKHTIWLSDRNKIHEFIMRLPPVKRFSLPSQFWHAVSKSINLKRKIVYYFWRILKIIR